MDFLTQKVLDRQKEIYKWIRNSECMRELPLYSSVDIRDSGFKMAVVDTNLFPAGFNNICSHGIAGATLFIKKAISKRVSPGKDILIIAEEHTRNTWYLENIRVLKEIIELAGYNVTIATFLTVQPNFCENANAVELLTATGKPIKIYCFKKILAEIKTGNRKFDLIILNNDLTSGVPDILRESDIPIYPSLQAGWHVRSKFEHFKHNYGLIEQFSKIIDVDPWLLTCLDDVVRDININDEADRMRMMGHVEKLFEKIEKKYNEYDIKEKPYIILKSDSGTYGMGVVPIENPKDILNLNRKNRNNLFKGKSAKITDRYILQEGISTKYHINQEISEVCIYQIDNNLIGGFYRSHGAKTNRDNLNSKGMNFKTMCPHLRKYGDCGVHHDMNIFDVYRLLGRIAGIAAHHEVLHLEGLKK